MTIRKLEFAMRYLLKICFYESGPRGRKDAGGVVSVVLDEAATRTDVIG